ncbi:FAD-binding domain-containing protein [Phanerochaete sordida]|uniref:FAD-binding domain-containing protein n=1 Tax=Phanerochaete sordida TaxID=48140 RepID=A0A9P3GL50_9APHY|nr:FAD-binding domain-containing protein [Phanerochaete sordida]
MYAGIRDKSKVLQTLVVFDHADQDSDLIHQPRPERVNSNAEPKRREVALFFLIDPASGTVIDGMSALSMGTSGEPSTRSQCERYLNITVVLCCDNVSRSRRGPRTTCASLHTTKLLIGAEGTSMITAEECVKLRDDASVRPTNLHDQSLRKRRGTDSPLSGPEGLMLVLDDDGAKPVGKNCNGALGVRLPMRR